ncbi:MAG: glutamate racemase [Succiniclasticum sp.]|jgi:glutamate racemase
MKIAFYDSGVGGLTVLHQAMKQLQGEQFIFLADEDHVPYGVKPREEVLGYVLHVADFLLQKGVKAIVVACNTATSVGLAELHRRYKLPILGMEPAVEKALNLVPGKRCLVIATPITCRGQLLRDQIDRVDKHHLVDALPMPKLVEFAEAMNFNGPEVKAYLKEQFAPYDFQQFGTLVLGCTHFNYFKDSLREVLPDHVRFVDACDDVLDRLDHVLTEKGQREQLPPADIEYFYSDNRVTDPKELQRLQAYLDRLEAVDSLQ